MTDIDHMIAVMQAAKEGKAIQCLNRYTSRPGESWYDAPSPIWNWAKFDYRVKPVEPRRVWMVMYPTMGGRSYVCYNSREEAAKFACFDASEQIEFVEVIRD